MGFDSDHGPILPVGAASGQFRSRATCAVGAHTPSSQQRRASSAKHFALTAMNTSYLLTLLALSLIASCSGSLAQHEPEAGSTLLSLKVDSLDGGPQALAQYKGSVLLIVNVASECGYTKQYAGLEALQRELAPLGFQVLGFPSNEFGGQEPGDAAQIRQFCTDRYEVSFPLFAKVATKPGDAQSPVYAFLGGATGELPAWNFGKYLVGRDGVPIAYHASKVAPDDAQLRAAIEKALQAPR
jgi:glutathione peroxidase